MLLTIDLPAEIVPALERFAQALTEHARTHRNASLAEHEQGVLDVWRGASARLLGGVVQAATSGLDPQRHPTRERCPRCDRRCAFRDQRDRTVLTCLGPLGFRRPWYPCGVCHQGWSPVDQTLGISAYERTSARLRTWEAALGAAHTFAEAQGLLSMLAGVAVGEETLRTHSEAVGARLEAEQQAAIAYVAAEQTPLPGTADPAPGHLVVETDGVFVRYREPGGSGKGSTAFHEVKLALVAGCAVGNGRPAADPAHVPPRLQAPSYVAARETAEQFGPRLLAEAARRGALDVVGWEQPPGTDPRLAGVSGPALAVLRQVQILGDGAVWIWHVSGEHFGERIEVVDWWHASEPLWELAKAVHGEGSAAATTWADQAAHRLWRHGPAPLLAWLKHAPVPPDLDGAKALRREQGYFTTNASRMQYPRFRRQGIPIGSGAIEAQAKALVQHRLTRAGMRWSPAGAQAVLTLRTHLLSGRPLAA